MAIRPPPLTEPDQMGHAQNQQEETPHNEKELQRQNTRELAPEGRDTGGGHQYLQASVQVWMGKVDEAFALRSHTDAGDSDLSLAPL